jgi:hypothetical protein
MAGGQPQRHVPLHPGRVQLDEPDRDLVRHHQQTGDPSGDLRLAVNHLIHRIRAYVEHWKATAEPFVWTATTEDILAKVRLVQTSVRKLVQNNSK